MAKEAAEADAAKQAGEECAALKAAELARKTEEERQARGATAEATRMAKEQRLALETAHKAEKERLNALPFSAERLILVRKLQLLQQLASQRLPLRKRLLGLKEMMAHQCC